MDLGVLDTDGGGMTFLVGNFLFDVEFWPNDDLWWLGATGARACGWNAVLLLDAAFAVAGLQNLALLFEAIDCIALLIGL